MSARAKIHRSRLHEARVEVLEGRRLLSQAAGLVQAYDQLPLSFEANRGQTDAQVQFLSRGAGYSLFLSSGEAVLSLSQPAATAGGATTATGAVLRMQLVGADPSPQLVGLDPLPGTSNYLVGNDPSQWRTDIPSYARVEAPGVYPGVDLTYYGNQRQLEYDFTVAPGVNAGVIRLAFQGAESMAIDAQGNLVLHTSGGDVVEQAPMLYQPGADGARQAVSGRYVLGSDGQVGFAVGAYDTSRSIIIDPVFAYSTFLGGSGLDAGADIALDSAGNIYITGVTTSTNFPTANPVQPTFGGLGLSHIIQGDAFVAKLDPTGSTLLYSTYLGGSGSDWGKSIAVDPAGDAYLTGETTSYDFPTVNPVQATLGGEPDLGDAFIAKLNPSGSALLYSTYLGGSDAEQPQKIAVDSSGDAYVTGATSSTDFPTFHALQGTFSGGFSQGDGFVTKLNPAGSFGYSTYFGGSSDDDGDGIIADAAGNAYIVGFTRSSNFPTVNPLQATLGGRDDAILMKLNPTGSALVYSTYLGGSELDQFNDIALDAAGNVYVVGATNSTNFPTLNPLQPTPASAPGYAIIAKINPAGSALVYSTYLGGSGSSNGAYVNAGSGIAVDSNGDAFVTGYTSSSSFPTVNPVQATFGGVVDAFVSEINPAGSALVYSTYIGGKDVDRAYRIALDGSGTPLVVGLTYSTDFPTADPLQSALGGGDDIFLTKAVAGQAVPHSATTTVSSAPDPSTMGQAVTFTATVAGPGQAGVPTGTVTFREGNTTLGTSTLDSVGRATFVTSALGSGTHTIAADYGGDGATFGPSSGTTQQTVQVVSQVATTTTTVSSAPDPSTVGEAVTFTATVAGPGQAGVPTGTVTFRDGATTLGTATLDTDGRATLISTALAAGAHTITADYGGDSTFGPSSGTKTQTVQAVSHVVTTTTTVRSAPDPSTVGEAVTFTATVAGPGQAGVPTGTVTFREGDTTLGTGMLDASGRATFRTTALAAGAHTITADYGGDANDLPSTSTAVTQVVSQVVTPLDGPHITQVQRFGFHARPTKLVLRFNEALDPARAGRVTNYRIVGADGIPIAITSAVYDAKADTVTLTPKTRLDLHKIYTLTVNGTGAQGVSDPSGNLLDGANNGRPGSKSLATVTAANLVLTDPPGGPLHLKRLHREVARIAAHELAILERASSRIAHAAHGEGSLHGRSAHW